MLKGEGAVRNKWNCDKCKTERVRLLQNDLQNALRLVNELKARNKELEEELFQARVGKRVPVLANCKATKCMVIRDSMVRNVGSEQAEMRVECFTGIKTEQLHRVMDKADLGSPETVIFHVGTNDLKATGNLDRVMGEVYDLVATVKKKIPNSRLVLGGVIRHRDTSWRRIGALNDRLEWIAEAFRLTFVDPNSWIEDSDFARDGLHLNGRGKKRLGQLYARVGGLDVGGSTGSVK